MTLGKAMELVASLRLPVSESVFDLRTDMMRALFVERSESADVIASLAEEVERLRAVVRDTLWMARRYAHGRQSYAVGMYNDAARKAAAIGAAEINPDGSIFAVDGANDGRGSPGMSGLSEQEFADAVTGLNAKNITPVPSKFARARTLLSENPNG